MAYSRVCSASKLSAESKSMLFVWLMNNLTVFGPLPAVSDRENKSETFYNKIIKSSRLKCINKNWKVIDPAVSTIK